MHLTSTLHNIPNFTSFQSTCGKNHIMGIWKFWQSWELHVRYVVWMKWQWRRLSTHFFPYTSPNHYSTTALSSMVLVVCNSPYQAAHYHILGIQVVGLISNPTHGWLQNNQVFILHITHTKDHDRHNVNVCCVHWVPTARNDKNYHKSKLTSRPSAATW